jgi:hypothetical protein
MGYSTPLHGISPLASKLIKLHQNREKKEEE